MIETTDDRLLWQQNAHEDFRHEGMVNLDRDRLNIFVKTSENQSTHCFSTCPVTPSGSVAFLGWTALSTHLKSPQHLHCECVVLGG